MTRASVGVVLLLVALPMTVGASSQQDDKAVHSGLRTAHRSNRNLDVRTLQSLSSPLSPPECSYFGDNTLPTICKNGTIGATQNARDVPKIIGLRWINADTNQPVELPLSTFVAQSLRRPSIGFHRTPSVWLPRSSGSQTFSTFYYNDYNIPGFVSTGNNYTLSSRWSIEAVTQGPIGSVVFNDTFFTGTSNNSSSRRIENAARWALCANNGADFFACPDDRNIFDGLQSLVVTAYSGKSGTGSVLDRFLTDIKLLRTAPVTSLDVYSGKTGRLIPPTSGLDASSGIHTFNLTELGSTNLTFALPVVPNALQWFASKAEFNYDNGTIVRTIHRPLQNWPGPPKNFVFFMFGATCEFAYIVDASSIPKVDCSAMGSFAPTLGRHTILASLYSYTDMVGATRTLVFDVVV